MRMISRRSSVEFDGGHRRLVGEPGPVTADPDRIGANEAPTGRVTAIGGNRASTSTSSPGGRPISHSRGAPNRRVAAWLASTTSPSGVTTHHRVGRRLEHRPIATLGPDQAVARAGSSAGRSRRWSRSARWSPPRGGPRRSGARNRPRSGRRSTPSTRIGMTANVARPTSRAMAARSSGTLPSASGAR